MEKRSPLRKRIELPPPVVTPSVVYGSNGSASIPQHIVPALHGLTMVPGSKKKPKLLVLGMGFTGLRVAMAFREKLGFSVCGTVRRVQTKLELIDQGMKQIYFLDNGKLEIDTFRLLEDVSHVLMCIPPQPSMDGDYKDKVLETLHDELKKLTSLKWVGYLSSTSVYGDSHGEILDETAILHTKTERGKQRALVEQQWLDSGLPVHIFRCAGIYGPGRGTLAQVRKGIAKRINVPGKVFNRIHIDDVVNVLMQSVASPSPGSIYNVCDDEPTSGDIAITYACSLLNKPVPPLLSWEEAKGTMSEMAKFFYAENRLLSNAKIKNELHVSLLYPTYREGFIAQVDEESVTPATQTSKTHICFVVNKGSMEPEAVLALRELCHNLSIRFNGCVRFVPSSCILANSIPQDELNDTPAVLFEEALGSVLEEPISTTQFVVLPVYIGNSDALTDFIPSVISKVQEHTEIPFRYAIGRCLVDISKPSDNGMAKILAEKVLKICHEHHEYQRQDVRVIVVDRGTTNHEVHLSRNLIGSQLNVLLAKSVNTVVTASMERIDEPKYDFNEPLLANAFDTYKIDSGLVIIALLFLTSGRHAVPGGDIENTLGDIKAQKPNLEIAVTSPIGSHPILTNMLMDRYFESIKELPFVYLIADMRSTLFLSRRNGILGLLSASAAAVTYADDGKDGPTAQEKIVGRYENRLRRFSTPERVFEYFASIQLDKQSYMTPNDFSRALTPYSFRKGVELRSKNVAFNPSAALHHPKKEEVEAYKQLVQHLMTLGDKIDAAKLTKQGPIPGEIKELEMLMTILTTSYSMDLQTHLFVLRELNVTKREFDTFLATHGGPQGRSHAFFDLVDADGDGLISYSEYMFFTTLLSIPERQFELAFKMFDDDGSGAIDHREFKQIMDLMRRRTPAGRQDRTLNENSTPVFKNLFGEFATETLSYEKFRNFRQNLKDEVTHLLFEHYDVDSSGELSSREFAMFLISHVDQKQLDEWVAKVDKLHDLDHSISEKEFKDFYKFLDSLDAMKVAMELIHEKKGLNKQQFLRATRAACGGGPALVSTQQIDIIFALFDADGDGCVSPAEFLDVMESRRDAGLRERRDIGAVDFFKRFVACAQETILGDL
ncbi:NAD-dependent epimerase/dehydratase [Thraustotheca clavata]|uniref:NAD-dependent epimerase/dehydratase n=1 Tax=Thraustotheca clavata TaxID=74557 RepID=A0A1V9Z2E4_9STRA|nr:NAD-dependent epimerase/dehydratase [Thraustotheca clavata]